MQATVADRRSRWRALARTGAVVALVVAVVSVASPAFAHAQLESTDPVQSSVLAVSPHQVVLHFGEPVAIDFGSMRVIGPGGRRVDEGGTHHPDGDSHAVAISLPSHLPDGTYIVAWRVISADSHPVHGAFIFSVGTARGAAQANALAGSLTKANGSTTVGVVAWVVRVATFVGLLVLVGTTLTAVAVWRRAAASRRVRRVWWAAWALSFIVTAVGIAVQGVYAAALPLTEVVHPTLIDDVLHTRFGEVSLLRLLLLVAMVPVLMALGRQGEAPASVPHTTTAAPRHDAAEAKAGAEPEPRGPKLLTKVAVVIGGVALLLTPGLAGHASTGTVIAGGIVLDVVHLTAASIWIGALIVLAFVLTPRQADPVSGDPVVVARSVSAWSLGAVACIVASGVLQSLRQVGSWSALVDTVYGRTLLVKVAVVLVVVVVAALSRRTLHGRLVARGGAGSTTTAPRGGPTMLRALRTTVVVELVGLAAVLAVTGLLVNAVPARQVADLPYTQTFQTLGVQVNAIVDPARAGVANQFHFYVLGRDGAPKAIPELDASIALPASGIGPIAIPLVVASPGHYQAQRVDIPLAGAWTLKITVRTSAIDEQELTATLPVH
jgi:copper transport protein